MKKSSRYAKTPAFYSLVALRTNALQPEIFQIKNNTLFHVRSFGCPCTKTGIDFSIGHRRASGPQPQTGLQKPARQVSPLAHPPGTIYGPLRQHFSNPGCCRRTNPGSRAKNARRSSSEYVLRTIGRSFPDDGRGLFRRRARAGTIAEPAEIYHREWQNQ